MRLVIDGHRLTDGRTGVGRVLEMLLDTWSQTGWPIEETLLVTTTPLVTPHRWPGLRIHSGGANLPGVLWRQAVLAPLVKRDDILFCPTNLLPFTRTKRTVLFVFDTLLESLSHRFPLATRLRFRARYRISAQRANRIIVPSMATRDDVVRHFGITPERIHVVPLAPDPIFRPAEPSPTAAPSPAAPYYLVVGKRSRRRRFDELLQAFRRHRDSGATDELIVVGPEPPVPDAGPGITWRGFATDDELARLYRSAQATFYLSEYEGFGLPIVEAQACGCPVVTMRNSALVETAGQSALFVDNGDPDELLAVLHRFGSDPELRRDLSARGLENARRFSARRMALDVAEILRASALASQT